MTLADVLKKEWPIWLVLLAPLIAIPFVWDQLPSEIPIHWNLSGEADSYAPKLLGLLLLPALSIITYVFYGVLPRIDPKRKISLEQRPISALRRLLPVFLTVIFFVALNKQLNPEADIIGGVFVGVAVFMMVIGNYMNNIQPNYFIGIRTPWTLQDSDVWRQTHRLGGRVWIIGGAALLFCWLVYDLETMSRLFFPILGVMILAPVGYSYVLYKEKVQHEEEASTDDEEL